MTRLVRLVHFDTAIGAALALGVLITTIMLTKQWVAYEEESAARTQAARKAEPSQLERRINSFIERTFKRGRIIWL